MRVRITCAALAISLCGVLLLRAQAPEAPQAPPAAQQTIITNVNLVNVLFTVVNNRNKIIADMEQRDFKVFDNNSPQEIRFFSHQTDLPLRVGLLLDTSNSIRQRLSFEQDAASD